MSYFSNIRNSKTYKVLKAISTSAVVALILSFMFFTYDVYKESSQERRNQEHFDKTVDRLEQIRESLSTRFLGQFPSYLTEICNVFDGVRQNDTIIVFEDVVYYGIKSRPAEFCKFNRLLLNHARQGGVVIVAYYDNHINDGTPYWTSVFHRMIEEGRISQVFAKQLEAERSKQIRNLVDKTPQKIDQIASNVDEMFFRKTVELNRIKAEDDIKKYIEPLTSSNTESDIIINRMCQELDSIKQHYIGSGKTIDDVHFTDYEQMYSAITDCIIARYRDNGVELVPLNEYLTMSCWLLKPAEASRPIEAILAFPSKYASDEIGFYSQDASFATYITTILKGVKTSLKN